MKKYTILILLVILNLVSPKALLLAQEKAETPEHSYNKGVDFYNKLDYNKAIENFLKAFNTGNNRLEQWINYNLGNAAFETGQKAQETNPQAAQQAYKQALEFFHRAIELNAQDENAKHNYELTALKLEQAKQKQQQKEQQDEQEQKEQQDEQGQKEQQDEQAEQEKKPSQQEAQPQEMTEEQAKMLLENFQNSEDRPAELRMFNSVAQDSDTGKDW